MKAALGVALVAAHVAGFVLVAPHCAGDALRVRVAAEPSAPTLAITGDVPASLAERVTTDITGDGLQRKRWSVTYRGGFTHSVGVAQLVGPFQDPAARTCTGRVVVSQSMLADIALQTRAVLQKELAGQSITGAGDFTAVSAVELRWSTLEWHPEDRAMVRKAPHGYVRAALTIAFERVNVPVVIALIPEPTANELRFRVASRAALAFGNSVAQWISDRVGGNALATRLAREQIDGALLSALAPPPPFELGDGQTLTFTYCAEPVEIVEGVSGAVPFSVQITGARGVLPPARGRAGRLPLASGAKLAIDLDLDALNAVLFELWHSGYLDRVLDAAGLATLFNTDPLVQELLSLRISPVTLALPPVLSISGDRLRLSADARTTISDGAQQTLARVWGGIDFGVVAAASSVAATPDASTSLGVDLGALELSCEPTPGVLAPCYADLVSAIRGRGDEFHGALTSAFTALLSDVFVERRLGATGLPADLVIHRAVPRITTSGTSGSLHLDLSASLVRN